MNRVLLVLFLFLLPLAGRAQSSSSATLDKTQFAQALQQAVSNALESPEQFSNRFFHWVLLVDTSQYKATAPVADADSQVLEELFKKTIRPGDHVSVIPFQLRPFPPTLWNQPVLRYEDLRASLPETTQNEGHNGGRDIEAAVKYALTRLAADGNGGTAVLLVLSASPYSEVPSGEPHYPLTTEHDALLTKQLANLHSAQTVSLVSVPTSQKGGEKSINLYIRAYIPQPLSGVSQSQSQTGTVQGQLQPISVGQTSSPSHRWLFLLLAVLVILAAIFFVIRRMIARKTPPTSSYLLVLDHVNRRFPECGRIEVYGSDLKATTVGSAQEPARISVDNPDLPMAAHGHLFTFNLDNRKMVDISPHLYTTMPANLPFDQETVLRLIPAEGVDGFPIQVTVTVCRQ